MSAVTIVVLAKEPHPGRVKTRLCPPCTPIEAANLAAAALADTLAAVAVAPARERVLVLDGRPGAWLPHGLRVVPQVPGDLGVRLSAAFAAVGGPALLVGMDTPQLQPTELASAADALVAPGTHAVLGLARDGGWWALGLQRPHDDVFAGVPMSTPHTGARQRSRLAELGLTVAMLPEHRDVDHFDDALAVAAAAPNTRFAATVSAVDAAIELRASAVG